MAHNGFLLLSVSCKRGLEYCAGEARLVMCAHVNEIVYCLFFDCLSVCVCVCACLCVCVCTRVSVCLLLVCLSVCLCDIQSQVH